MTKYYLFNLPEMRVYLNPIEDKYYRVYSDELKVRRGKYIDRYVQRLMKKEIEEYWGLYSTHTLVLDEICDIVLKDLSDLATIDNWWCYDFKVNKVHKLAGLLDE